MPTATSTRGTPRSFFSTSIALQRRHEHHAGAGRLRRAQRDDEAQVRGSRSVSNVHRTKGAVRRSAAGRGPICMNARAGYYRQSITAEVRLPPQMQSKAPRRVRGASVRHVTVMRAGLSLPASKLGSRISHRWVCPPFMSSAKSFTAPLNKPCLTPFSEVRQGVSATKCGPR